MKIGVIGLKGKWSTEKLVEEIINQGHDSHVIEMEDVVFDLANKKVTYQGEDLETYDGFIIKKLGREYSAYLFDRLEVLDYLHKSKGVVFFPSPHKIGRLLNRYSCTKELVAGGVAMPETLVTENVQEANKKLSEFGEAIVKPLFTSKSRGMIKVKYEADCPERSLAELKDFQSQYHTIYLQKIVRHPGYDLGVCFLGDEYLGTYARVGSKDGWNTTTRTGGHYEQKWPEQEIIELARQAKDLFGLDFSCVDVVETEDGPKVFEVSAFGGFKGLQESAGINLAAEYAKYVISKLGIDKC